MDSLLEKLAVFNITRDEDQFNTDIDDVIDRLNCNLLEDHDYQWNKICENYSKLKYLDDIIKNYYIPESDKFLVALDRFMATIEKMNLIYIKEIDWHQNEHPDCLNIKLLLDTSVNEEDPLTKLDLCVKAYSLLVPIIEIIRNEKRKEIEQTEKTKFVEEFNFKRRKMI